MRKLLNLLLASLLVWPSISQAQSEGQVPDAVEYAALVALYNSTNGDGWNRNDNWLQDTNFATWYGVTVRNGDVTGLVLSRNQLTGEIPEALGNLTNLTSLQLHYNQLEGTIPASFGQLTKVTLLNLAANRLTGPLPDALGNMSSLTQLSLSNNPIASSVPASLGQLSELRSLSMGGCQLTGSIPKELGQLTNLTTLTLNRNQLTGEIPEALGNLTNLTSLIMDQNKLQGAIPASFGQLTKLTRLDLFVNRLSGIPNFRTAHPDPDKLQLRVQNNRISLNDIAQNLTGPDTHSFSLFQYHNQGSAQDTITVVPVLGETLTLERFSETPPHPQTNYQWQRQVSGEWGDIESANGSTLTLVGVTAADTGFYRFRITNDWLEGMVQQGPSYHLVLDKQPAAWLEAECATVGSNWNVAEDANAAGGKYLTYPSGTSMNGAPTNPADHVTFSVVTATAGSYHLQARIRAPSGSNDSFWFKVNDGDWIKWWQGITRGTQFNWNTATGSPFTLTAGNHTITVAYRESGTQLDKLYLSSSSESPDGLGDVDSTCAQPLTEIIIDNADPGFSTSGSWSNSTQQSGNRYGSNYVHDGNTGKGSKTATFSANVAPGTYEVYGWWSASSNRATNVPYDIVDACGTNTVLVNQRTNGASWQLLGTYTFGQTAQVTLRTDGTDAYVIADAVKLTPLSASAAPDSVAVDNAGPGFSITGSWSTSTTTGPYYQSNYAHDQNSDKGNKTATFQATVTPGSYEVFAWWSADGNRASNVPFDVVHQAGTNTVVKNQRQQGGQWVPLGTYDFGTTAQVTIRNTGTDGYVMADGVLFVGGGSSPATPCDTVPDDYEEIPGEPLAFRPQWGGNVAAMVWSTFHYTQPVYQQAYTYDYSQANRLTEARYASQDTDGGWTANQSNYSVHDIGYDANGNITGLTRYTAAAVDTDPVATEQGFIPVRRLMDQLSYTYTGNRVQAVSDAADAELGFADGASNGNEYGYDANGNLTRDDNKGITNIAYDPVLDVPLRVDFADGARIDYLYDAAGNRLAQTITAVDGTRRTTDYVGAVEYRNDQLALIHQPEGRVIKKADGSFVYHYDLRDHLGNVRLTFSEEPMVESSDLTMETPAAPAEEALFEHVAAARQTLAFHNTTTASSAEPQPNKVARLQAGQTGPAKSLSVRAGDQVHLQVNAAYETGRGKVQGLEGIATQVAGAVSRSAAGLESAGAITGSNGLAAGSALTIGKQQGVPPAYLNYLVYDTDFQLVDQGFVQVSEDAATQVGSRSADGEGETLALDVAVKQNGYLYAYLSHEAEGSSSSATAVYFDDFTVEHQGISIVQHNDYYAFGATYEQSADRVLNNAYLYQGKELQDGLGLDLYDFHARQYDPLLGRFTSLDPMNQFASGYTGMGNNPVNMVDPDGQLAFAALAGGIMLKGVTVTASALTAGALVKGAALMAGKFALATAASSIASGIGGAGCCPGVRGSYNNPIGSGGELEHDVYGYIPGNVPYQAVSPMAPVSPVASQGMNALQGVQMLGDVASFVPGLNVVGGLTSAGASLAMGNYGAAAFAAATAIPVAGVALKVGKAVLAGVKTAKASRATGKFYSVAYQMQLSSKSYPGVTRYMHFKEANISLNNAMEANSSFAAMMNNLGVSVPRSGLGKIIGESPKNWVWHHNVKSGVMDLVPKSQHPSIPGGKFWETMHPNWRGGFSIWGK